MKLLSITTKKSIGNPPIVFEGTPSYYSVRSILTMSCAVMFCMLGILWYFGSRYQNQHVAQQSGQRMLFEQIKSKSKILEASVAQLKLFDEDIGRLGVPVETISNRINEIAQQFSVRLISNSPEEKNGATTQSRLRSMTKETTGLSIKVRGTPEKVHLMFSVIESEFPGIILLTTSIAHPKGEEIELQTLYLVPNYEPIKYN